MHDLQDLRAWLKSHPADGAELSLSRSEVQALVDEIQRLHQSNDMLRKQNKKVRGKVARLRGGADDDVAPAE